MEFKNTTLQHKMYIQPQKIQWTTGRTLHGVCTLPFGTAFTPPVDMLSLLGILFPFLVSMELSREARELLALLLLLKYLKVRNVQSA